MLAIYGIRDTGFMRLVLTRVHRRCYTTPSTNQKTWENGGVNIFEALSQVPDWQVLLFLLGFTLLSGAVGSVLKWVYSKH